MKTRIACRIAARKALAATVPSVVSLAGFTGIAAADNVAPAPHQPGPIIANPAPQPEPQPQPADLPIEQPMPEPHPHPQPDPGPGPQQDLPLEAPLPDPGPDPALEFDPPIGLPQEDPEDPELPGGSDDLAVDPCTLITHGCGEDGTIDDYSAGDLDGDGCIEIIGGPEFCPTDEPGDEPGDEPKDEPKDESNEERGALPRTGAGLALLAGLGTTLTGAGLAAKRAARR